ncbi:amidohydrolase family protein [uncultured Roseovarius sp.]|uniref:amidohydrolase family protein n=1 Tax=uncultured Roseovarius sp. TaxID=293344 RepID=UPI002611F21A|nr:amidohydrolase family protein [uncultured Roseovarius sp.]
MHATQTLIRGGLVLVENAQFAPVSLLIEEGRIVAVIDGDGPDDLPILDATGRIVIPGLVNGHTHSHGALGRGGVPEDATLETFLAGGGALNGNRHSDDLRLSAELSAVEMIRKGCTACFDLSVELPGPSVAGIHAVAEAYHTAGLRAVVAPMISDRTIYQALPGLLDAFAPSQRAALAAISLPPWQETLAICTEAFARWPVPRDRVKPGLGPAIPLHCSDAFLTACAATAQAADLCLQTHLAETQMQQVAAHQRYGTSLTAHLDRLGLISPRFSGAHGVWLDPHEAALLASHGAGIVHNPLSNLRLGSGIAPLHALRSAGVTLGVGTDAANTSDAQNMFEALRLATTLSRTSSAPPEHWIGPTEAFRMATEGSARILGLDRVGRIAPGWAADLLFLDRSYCHYVPLRDPLSQIVFAETGAALREVMIAGALVFADNRVLTLDEASLAERAGRAATRLDAANHDARQMAEAAALIVRSFCRSACARHPHSHPL